MTIKQPPIPGIYSATAAMIPRPPGWNLVANTSGVQGFHIVDHTNPGGGVTTVCEVIGRVITNDNVAIIPCPACEAGTS